LILAIEKVIEMEEIIKPNHDKNWTREILLYYKNLSKIEKG
jgi:hypothetical protein